MRIVQYIVGLISFILVSVVVALVVGFVMVLLFPPASDGEVTVGIGMNWRNLPGTILGVWAGVHSFRASIKVSKKPEKN